MPAQVWPPHPDTAAARDRFVLGHRAAKPVRDPWTSQGVVLEDELGADGQIARSATVFLTGRECPWRCVMCDLWRYTIDGDTPIGAIPRQVEAAIERLRRESPSPTQLKLYNAASFFDPRAVPEADYDAVAAALEGFSRVVVESHPALIGPGVDRWLDAMHAACARPPRLEVAMGLETANPQALERLHKRMTVAQFASAAAALVERRIDVRAFVLIGPPFVPADRQLEWLIQSVDVAFRSGASVVSLIPTRTGNGAIDAFEADDAFSQPALDTIERSVEAVFARARPHGRIFVDLWDLERFSTCPSCFAARRDRLHAINLDQRVLPRVGCSHG